MEDFFNSSQTPSAFFWRAQSGLEVDLIIQSDGKFWPIEIKLSATPAGNHLKNINRFKELAGDERATSACWSAMWTKK